MEEKIKKFFNDFCGNSNNSFYDSDNVSDFFPLSRRNSEFL